MTLTVKHTFVSAIPDGADATVVRPSNWNANHTLTGVTSPSQGGTGIANNDASTLAISGNFDLTFTLTGSTALTLPSSGTLTTTANNLSVFAATTSAQLAGVISDETGSGKLVFDTAPVFSTTITLGTQQTTRGSLILANTAAGAFATTIQSSNSATAAVTYTLPTAVAAAGGYVLTDAAGNGVLSWAAGGSGLTIGTTTITSGTSPRILYNLSNVLQEAAGVTVDPTSNGLVLTATATGAASLLTLTGQTGILAASQPVINATQTWNASGVTFTGIKAVFTTTASAAASLLVDLQAGSSPATVFKIKKDGTVQIVTAGAANAPALSFFTDNRGFYAGDGGIVAADGTNAFFQMAPTYVGMRSGAQFGWVASSSNSAGAALDTALTRPAPATLQHGIADAAAPVAQTLQVQSVVAGTSNTAGADWTLIGSKNTGTGVSGNLALKTSFSAVVAATTCTIANATGVVTLTTHGFVPGQPVVFTTSGSLPAEIVSGTTYYVSRPLGTSVLTANTFNVSTTVANAEAGTQVTTTNASTPTTTCTTSATAQSPAMNVATWGPSGVTGSQTTPALSIQQNWNTSGIATGIKLNVTNTASAAASLLMDLQIGTVSKFKVDKAGNTTWAQSAALTLGGSGFSLQDRGAGILIQDGGGIGFANPTRGIMVVCAAGAFVWTATSNDATATQDTFLTRGGAAATIQQGAADAAAPVAQTTQVQSVVAGTASHVGADWTFNGSKGTGTTAGAGGKIIFKTAPVNSGTGATAQNATVAALTLTAPALGGNGGTVTQQPSVLVGNAALATTDTDGFLYIPTCAGTPTGTPTAATGLIPMVFDTTNSQFWFYAGGAWKQPKTPAGAAVVTWQ